MSLEDAIAKLTLATEKQNTLLEAVLAKTGAAVPAEDAKPAAKTAKAEGEKAASKAETKAAVTVETLDAKFRPWLAEFGKDHVETAARKAKFKEVLTKLGAGKMSEITDADKLAKLDTWFETKAKTWDEGHGVGRFAADPTADPDADASGEDEL
jgi:hypothetical protein